MLNKWVLLKRADIKLKTLNVFSQAILFYSRILRWKMILPGTFCENSCFETHSWAWDSNEKVNNANSEPEVSKVHLWMEQQGDQIQDIQDLKNL